MADNNLIGADALEGALNGMPRAVMSARHKVHNDAANLVYRVARRYAPISPTMGQLKERRKTNRKVTRNKRSTNRPARGALQNSIEKEATEEQAAVFVASNSPAGRYAFKIHEEKGISWHKRGPGTQAKGPQADEKFISRAIEDNGLELDKRSSETIESMLKRQWGG